MDSAVRQVVRRLLGLTAVEVVASLPAVVVQETRLSVIYARPETRVLPAKATRRVDRTEEVPRSTTTLLAAQVPQEAVLAVRLPCRQVGRVRPSPLSGLVPCRVSLSVPVLVPSPTARHLFGLYFFE